MKRSVDVIQTHMNITIATDTVIHGEALIDKPLNRENGFKTNSINQRVREIQFQLSWYEMYCLNLLAFGNDCVQSSLRLDSDCHVDFCQENPD